MAADRTIFDRTRPCVETSEPKRNKFWRLRVYWDEDFGLISIADEQVTSLNDKAERVDGGDHDELQITSTEVRWMHQMLGELIAVLDTKKGYEP